MSDQAPDKTTARHAPDPTRLETHQPDPMLDLSTSRRMGAGGLSLFALAVLAILAIVFYGLNGRSTDRTASTPAGPPVATNSGAAHG